jgi:electron transport complex protein RnfD
MSRPLILTAPPHVQAPLGTAAIMWWVTATLVPVVLAATWFFGFHALLVILLCTCSAAGTEYLWRHLRKEEQTVADGSAALTGLLLALTLPPMVPWWIAVAGGFMAIVFGKLLFGGLGWNVFNPALVGRAFLLLSWVGHVSRDWAKPMAVVDAKTSATPLYAMKLLAAGEPVERFAKDEAIQAYLWGNLSGCIGEVSALLLLLGGAVLLAKRIIDWRIPVTYIGTVVLLTWALGKDPVFYLLAGGLFLGAFYMATDYVTSCITPRGKLIFGVGCGAVTVLLRFYSGLPESVMFAILFMNMCAPLIDRYTMPKKFGWVKPS